MAAAPLRFGEPRPGLEYRDRPSAYGLLESDGRLALVHVSAPGRAPFFDLPGGGIDEGESDAQALVREFGEETGLVVEAGELVTRADQFMINTENQPFLGQGAFYETVLRGERPDLKVEDDHTLVWLDANEALLRLRHDSHAWAVSAWLRARIPLR
jgi:8-oxo-dGTP diphosphatase